MSNPLTELEKVGQSIWFDQMERKLLSTGALKKMIEEDDLRGLTSNPTIFEKAIAGSEDYDDQLRGLASQAKSHLEIYDELVIQDIGDAADVFRPVYDRTQGADGFVSIEVSPLLAHDTQGTIDEAKRLFERLGRPNVMIKIPATPECIASIEQTIANGINVNVTLIFSNDVYKQVMEAYIRGLERRAERGEPIGGIASVASFFVSRIDAQADKQIEDKLKTTGDKELEELLGKVAIANAKLAYETFRQTFSSPRFQKLRDRGARVQRPLWASTGTKNPKYSDVLYIESLIGPDTVNTVPPATYAAFRDHGKVRLTLAENVDEAHRIIDKFHAKGFSLEQITRDLTTDGVKSFGGSFESLMSTIEARRDLAMRALDQRLLLHLGTYQAAVDEAISRADKEKYVERIWKKDASLWKKDDDAHKKIITNALGWLTVPQLLLDHAAELTAFADEVKSQFDHIVVLGMGGSSLCSEVTRSVFGRRAGYPELLILDSTVPQAVRELEKKLDLSRTLFLVASKSGSTTEPMMFHRYFYDRVRSVKGDRAGENFIAVTDPDTQLGRDAKADHFRRIFINPADIGGRYSALSYFGMVPAAVAGIDVKTLLDRAVHASHTAVTPTVEKNPAALLGVALGTLATKGRDKLTLITPAPLDRLGLWVEQLIAESTGKEGKGIVPIAGEPELPVNAYGKDRVFMSVRMRGAEVTKRLEELTAAGHPVIELILEDPLDLGETFFVWEFATAVAGAALGIDAFDQPNVQESKDNTKALLAEYQNSGKLQREDIVPVAAAREKIAQLIASVKPGDYVALTEYIAESPKRDALISQIREAIGSELHVATTTGYGPRFLHSTGQLHKGGAANGIFIQMIAPPGQDVPLPGEKFSFGVLAEAQALGDYQSLKSRDRRRVRIDLGDDIESGLQSIVEILHQARVKA